MILALLAYCVSMVAANLLVAQFGPGISPVLAFLLIGMDLALRDWLQVRLRAVQMAAVIVAAGALTFILSPGAERIAYASSLSFLAAALADWGAFMLIRGSWLRRSMGSNVVGAAVDSLVFPTLAFGGFMPGIMALQFVAKVAGGSLWAALLARMGKTKPEPA